MNCIKTDLIQKYIDRAATVKEADTVEKHIAVCRECSARLTELRHRADEVKKALNILVNNEVSIPGFIASVGKTKTREAKRIKRYVFSLFAASVLIFLVMAIVITLNTRTQQQMVVVHTVDREINANHTVTEQLVEINIIDANGKVTTSP